MRRVVALVALVASGCFAAPPPAAMPTELSGCHPGSHGALSELRCRRDSDCLLCRTPERACGVLESRAQLAITNDPCPRISIEECHGRSAACCGGRCVASLGAPPF